MKKKKKITIIYVRFSIKMLAVAVSLVSTEQNYVLGCAMSRCACLMEPRGSNFKGNWEMFELKQKKFDRFEFSNTYKKYPNLYSAHSQVLVI